MTKCLVVMSGGQDSTTCLALAKREYYDVEAACFDYGQSHKAELVSAREICSVFETPLHEIDLKFLNSLGKSKLTGNGESVFVTNRNAVFLTVAHGLAQSIGASTVMAGMCEGDFSGFSDCREAFIKSLEQALNLGYGTNISIETPLMHKSKKETFQLAEELGILDVIIDKTHTCYEGTRELHKWGYGCGECKSCKVRKEGWENFIQQKRMETTKV